MKVFLIGYYGVNNLGDDFFLNEITRHLKLKENIDSKDITVLVDSNSNKKIFETLNINIKNIKFSKKNKTLNFIKVIFNYIVLIRNNDLIIFGGGTQIQETGDRYNKTLLVKLLYLYVNKIFYKKKIIHFGVGLGDIRSKFGKFALKQILKYSDFFIYRDENSLKIHKNIINNIDQTYLTTDLGFSRELNKEILMKNNIIHIDSHKPSFKVGISLLKYSNINPSFKKSQEEFDENLIAFIEKLPKNTEIYFIPFQSKFGKKDYEYMETLKNKLKREIHLIEYTGSNISEVIKLISSMDLCIGMRFHFLIFSILFNKPVLPIIYHEKVKILIEEFNIEKYSIDLKLSRNINEKYKLICTNYSEIKKYIGFEKEKKLDINDKSFKILSEIVKGESNYEEK